MSDAKFAQWSILELMGHRRLAGFVTEEEIAGVGLLRLDVPGEDGETEATQYYHPNALYCITPTTEEIARAVALSNRPAPVQPWELPKLPEPKNRPAPIDDYDNDSDDDGDEDEEYEDGAGEQKDDDATREARRVGYSDAADWVARERV